MQIERLTLQNFRGFDQREFHFHPRFNLLIGENASGKSSLLDALGITVGAWFLGIPGLNKPPGIEPGDVRVVSHRHIDSYSFEKQFPARVECVGRVMGKSLTWARELRSEGGHTTSVDAKGVADVARQAEAEVRVGAGVVLPLICAFGTERLWFEKSRHPRPAGMNGQRMPSRLDGYKDSLNFTIQESVLLAWMRDQLTISLPRKSAPIAFRLVQDAVRNCVDGAGDLYFDGRYDDLVVGMNDGLQLFRNLSDGQRILLTLVGDLARRAAVLNPQLGDTALKETPGIVLIDELDLHLHPRWQRRVIADLKRTFPCLQFVTSTHSPQLIGEARPEEIILLEDGEATNPPRSFGMDSGRVLEQIMGADSRDSEVKARLEKLSRLIDREDFEAARHLIDDLEVLVDPDDSELTRARALISFLETPLSEPS